MTARKTPIDRRFTARDSVDSASVVAMYAANHSLRNIASIIGCGHRLVHAILADAGVTLRAPGKPVRIGGPLRKPVSNKKPVVIADVKPLPPAIWERADYKDIRAAVSRGVTAKNLAAAFRIPYRVALEAVAS